MYKSSIKDGVRILVEASLLVANRNRRRNKWRLYCKAHALINITRQQSIMGFSILLGEGRGIFDFRLIFSQIFDFSSLELFYAISCFLFFLWGNLV